MCGLAGAFSTEGEMVEWAAFPGGGIRISRSEETEMCRPRQQVCSKVYAPPKFWHKSRHADVHGRTACGRGLE